MIAGSCFTILHQCNSTAPISPDAAAFDIRGGLVTGTITRSSYGSNKIMLDAMLSNARILATCPNVVTLGDVGVVSASGTVVEISPVYSPSSSRDG